MFSLLLSVFAASGDLKEVECHIKEVTTALKGRYVVPIAGGFRELLIDRYMSGSIVC